MIEKLTETTEVRTFMVSVRCPNKSCSGSLASDGHERTENGAYGGPKQFRHRCDTCEAGYWLPEQFPKVKYEPVRTETPAKMPIKNQKVHTTAPVETVEK